MKQSDHSPHPLHPCKAREDLGQRKKNPGGKKSQLQGGCEQEGGSRRGGRKLMLMSVLGSRSPSSPISLFFSFNVFSKSYETLWEKFWQEKTHKYVETLQDIDLKKETMETEA